MPDGGNAAAQTQKLGDLQNKCRTPHPGSGISSYKANGSETTADSDPENDGIDID